MRAALLMLAIAALRVPATAEPRAETLYAEGQAAYDRADYAAAIESWSESYRISGAPGLLFNLAQAQRLSGDCPTALSTYREFLTADADDASEQHRLAEDLARELDATCDEPPAATRQPRPDDPPPTRYSAPGLTSVIRLSGSHDRTTRPGRVLRVAGLATGGAGVALLVTGLVVGHHARSLGDEVTRACAAGCDWAALSRKDAAGRRDVSIGRALDIVGVAAIAGGAVMYYLGSRPSSVSVAPAEHRDGAVVSWSGSW